MKEFSLTVTNDLGTFDFNFDSLKALEDFLVYSFPLVNTELAKTCDNDLDDKYNEHIKSILPKLRVLYYVLHHDL